MHQRKAACWHWAQPLGYSDEQIIAACGKLRKLSQLLAHMQLTSMIYSPISMHKTPSEMGQHRLSKQRSCRIVLGGGIEYKCNYSTHFKSFHIGRLGLPDRAARFHQSIGNADQLINLPAPVSVMVPDERCCMQP